MALGLTVFLNVGKLERTLSEVQESRLRFTLNELRTNLQTGLDLGLPVKGLGNADAALDAEVTRDPDILSISVLDTAGAVIFQSGPAAPTSHYKLENHKQQDWIVREPGAITLGAGLSSNFGASAGAVVMRYSQEKQNAAIGLVSRELTLAAICAVVVTTLGFIFGIHALVRRMDRAFGSMQAALEDKPGPAMDRYAAALVEQVKLTSKAAEHDLEAACDTLNRQEAAQ